MQLLLEFKLIRASPCHTDAAKQNGNNMTPSWMSLMAGDASTQRISCESNCRKIVDPTLDAIRTRLVTVVDEFLASPVAPTVLYHFETVLLLLAREIGRLALQSTVQSLEPFDKTLVPKDVHFGPADRRLHPEGHPALLRLAEIETRREVAQSVTPHCISVSTESVLTVRIQESTIRDGDGSVFRFKSSEIGDSIIGPATLRPWSLLDSARRRSGESTSDGARVVDQTRCLASV